MPTLANHKVYCASLMNLGLINFSVSFLAVLHFSSPDFLFFLATGHSSLYTDSRCVMISGLTPDILDAVQANKSRFSISI